jgi:3-oxoacyl-[acyl-carrier protein] reductase
MNEASEVEASSRAQMKTIPAEPGMSQLIVGLKRHAGKQTFANLAERPIAVVPALAAKANVSRNGTIQGWTSPDRDVRSRLYWTSTVSMIVGAGGFDGGPPSRSRERTTMDLDRYRNRIEGHALVLGGSGGIGSEIVRALVAAGARAVTLTYGRNKAAADTLVDELGGAGVQAFAAPVDQADEDSVRQLLDAAAAANNQEITVAVISIGISPNVPIEEQTLDGKDGWRNVFDINVHGCFVSTRAIANRMKAKSVRGSIVLITSTNGINSQSQISAHYDSSKAAQGHMMRIFAEHYAPAGIRINGVAPGWIDTKLNDSLPDDERERETRKIWSRRFAAPHEIATFVAFIAGSGGSYAYGQNFMVDGGYR